MINQEQKKDETDERKNRPETAVTSYSDFDSALRRYLQDEKFSGTPERETELTIIAAKALKSFLDEKEYGKPSDLVHRLKYWPFIRFLIWDLLRPSLNQGETDYANHNFSDKFIQDLSNKAHEIQRMLPEDLTSEEWLLLVSIWSHMLQVSDLFIDHKVITQEARDQLSAQSQLIGWDDMHYHNFFAKVVREAGDGPREK